MKKNMSFAISCIDDVLGSLSWNCKCCVYTC